MTSNILNNTKLLGQGSYGCIFKPGITPKKFISKGLEYNKTKKISKLLIKSKDKELIHLKKLAEINSEAKYHPKFNPNNNIINTNETKEILSSLKTKFPECKIIFKGDNDDKYIINMEFGGIDIKKYLKANSPLSIKKTILFLHDYINLIDGLILFRENKLAIMDIKDLNIVYNTELSNHRMRFIDFGIMLDYGKITRNDLKLVLNNTRYLYVFDYYQVYPPEILLLIPNIFDLLYNFSILNKLDKKTLLINLENYILNKKLLKNTKLGVLFLKMIDIYIKMIKKNIKLFNYSKDIFYFSLCKRILSLVDTYSLLCIIKFNSNKLNNSNNIITNIISMIPTYTGTNKKTLFSLPKLELIKHRITKYINPFLSRDLISF
jgi:hypothetical protein